MSSQLSVEFIPGPSITDFSREAAEQSLRRHAKIAAGSPYAMEQLEGRWVAAIVHQAEFPPGDSEEEAPSPKPEGGGAEDSAPEPDGDEGPSPDAPGDDDGDESDSSDKDGKGGELQQVLDAVNAIAQALGIPLDLGGEGGDEGGPDAGLGPEGPPGPPGGPDAGPPMPPGPPQHGGPGTEQRIIHEKALKPGEVPPGATPVGAPAFSSVRPDHPFAHLASKLASFHVQSDIGDKPLQEAEAELQALAGEIGYRVARFTEARSEDGNRIAVAVVTKH